MVCPMRKRGLGYCLRHEKRNMKANTPKPVQPRPLHNHGFLSMDYLKQHLMADKRWTPESLAEQYKTMTDVISNHIVYKQHVKKSTSHFLSEYTKELQNQCLDGRAKLKHVIADDNKHKIHNFLVNHKDLQRLYQNMPIDMVADNIDQRVFVMRKERDRLESRLNQQKIQLKSMLVESARLENYLKFKFELEEEEKVASRTLMKKLENSKTRFRALKTIKSTYLRIISVLMHDEIFYEPILRSLSVDMNDQLKFIEYVIDLMPGEFKLNEMKNNYAAMQNEARISMQSKMQLLSSLKLKNDSLETEAKQPVSPDNIQERYVRETQSLMILKVELDNIEKTIKEVKFVSLCSHAQEIYPRIKSQTENNKMLNIMSEKNKIARDELQYKLKNADELKGILVNNLSPEETDRLERIKDLTEMLKNEEEFEQNTLQYLKNRADLYVLVRISLWNLVEIVRHVDSPHKIDREPYPNSYLKLPLLKFEMLDFRAAAPEVFESNIENLLDMVKRKLKKLLHDKSSVRKSKTIKDNVEAYHAEFLTNLQLSDTDIANDKKSNIPSDDDLEHNNKILALVPNRKQIKAQSAKILEDRYKRED